MWKELCEKGHTQYQKHLGGNKQEELLVGTRDKINVYYVAFRFNTSLGYRTTSQFFFKDNTPSGCYLAGIIAPSWHLNRPPMPEKYKPHFEELGEQFPSLKESLETCIALLEEPGPKYEIAVEGTILTSLE